MSKPQNTVVDLELAITGNLSVTSLPRRLRGGTTYGSGLDAGGQIEMGTATSAAVLVTDANGIVLHNATITDDTTVEPTAQGISGPLKVTVTSISNAAHTLTVRWKLKK